MSCTCSRTGASSDRVARSWPSHSKIRDTAGSRPRWSADMAYELGTYVAEWERAERTRQAGEPAALTRAREHAWSRFRSLRFPTTRDEDWRFTSVAPIAERAFSLADPAADDR